eukprot:31427-Pelagococcus_subviridis.AAC.13
MTPFVSVRALRVNLALALTTRGNVTDQSRARATDARLSLDRSRRHLISRQVRGRDLHGKDDDGRRRREGERPEASPTEHGAGSDARERRGGRSTAERVRIRRRAARARGDDVSRCPRARRGESRLLSIRIQSRVARRSLLEGECVFFSASYRASEPRARSDRV